MIDDIPLSQEQMRRAFGRVVFLSHVNTPGMPVFPGDPAPAFERVAGLRTHGFALQRVSMGEHSGTHWGAPCHLSADGACASELPAASFVFAAVVVDIRAQAAADPDYALNLGDIELFEARHGPIPPRAMVVAFTGRQEHWDDPKAYLGTDDRGVSHFPGFGADAVRWLIANRDLGGLGIDTHGIDPGLDQRFAANAALLAGSRIHLENLTNLESLPPKGAWIVVGGQRNENGTGSPATVFGFLP